MHLIFPDKTTKETMGQEGEDIDRFGMPRSSNVHIEIQRHPLCTDFSEFPIKLDPTAVSIYLRK